MDKSILILVSRRTNRLLYILRYVFENRLRSSFEISISKEEFLAYSGFKLNFSQHRIEDVLHLIPSNILFEKRLQEPQLEVSQHAEFPLLFANNTKELGHDVLGAIFYLISRYEEYLPFRKDRHGRFPASESAASKYGFLKKPLVDLYIIRFAKWLNTGFGIEHFKARTDFKQVITMDVDQVFMFKAKGLARTALALAKDALKDQKQLSTRSATVFNNHKDPNDIYDEFLDAAATTKSETIFFFQVGDGSRFDVNNPPHLPRIKSKMNELSLKTEVGLHPSYFSSDQPEMMQREFGRFNALSNMKLFRSRQHYLRFQIPSTFRTLEELGVSDEYSMAYADDNGFRASTCFPYPFFDLFKDEVTALTIHPTCFLDITSVRSASDISIAKKELEEIYNEVIAAGGHMITVWHPEVLNGYDVPFGSRELYVHLLDISA